MFENQKILILGFARSGYEAAKVLVGRGNKVILNDSKEESKLEQDKIAELRSLGVELVFGSHPDDLLDSSFDYLIKNPGVPIHHKYVLKARELGIEVLNEVEMAYRLFPEGVKLIGITGTNGKTTTTSLTYEIVKKAYGEKTFLAGNIGYPLSSILNDLKSGDIVVMEVSCQQLANLSTFRPNIAVMTNLSPAHIDFFGSYDEYKKVKLKLFVNQRDDDIAILNIENDEVMKGTTDIKSNVKYFSSKREVNGAYFIDNKLYYYDEFIINRDEFLLKGNHNVENALGAMMIAKEVGVDNESIVSVLKTFTGVRHRLEFIDKVNGVDYYNDTEATNTKCTTIALSSFDKNVILILGGLERGQDFHDLDNFISPVKEIVGIGECRDRVKEYGDSVAIKTNVFEKLVDAMNYINSVVMDGDTVLLSPASASWDQYKQCEDRGDEFRDIVKKCYDKHRVCIKKIEEV